MKMHNKIRLEEIKTRLLLCVYRFLALFTRRFDGKVMELNIVLGLFTPEGRNLLAQAMATPIRRALDYQGVGRRLLMVDELPQGASFMHFSSQAGMDWSLPISEEENAIYNYLIRQKEIKLERLIQDRKESVNNSIQQLETGG